MTVVGRDPLPDEFRGTWLCALGVFVVRVSRGLRWTLATIHVWRPAVAIGGTYTGSMRNNGGGWAFMEVGLGALRVSLGGTFRAEAREGGFSCSVVGGLVHSNLLLHTSRSRTGLGGVWHGAYTSEGDQSRR